MNKSNNLTYKIPLMATLIAILTAVPLRVYQYLKLINPETGFFDNTDASIVLTYAVLAVAMVVCIVSSFINHKSLIPITIGRNSKIFFAVSLTMAVGIAVDSFIMLSDYISLYSDIGAATVNGDISAYVSAQGGTLMLAQAISGAVSAVYFAVAGISSIKPNNLLKLKILAITPVIWCIFRLLFRFKRTISFVNVSDLLLELFAIVFAMMFLLALAQVNSKIDAPTVFWKLFAYGFPAATFSLVCFLPRFILLITGNSDKLNALYMSNLSDLTFAIYSVYICISAAKAKIPANEE